MDHVVTTEVPQTWITLFRQRCLGWNPGFMGNVRLLASILFSRKKPIQLRFDALYNMLNIPLDVLRVISLPILFKYPLFFVLMYLLYIAIDLHLYRVMRRKDPYYTVFVAPFYGIFCMITRFIGMLIYIYREFAELLYWRMRSIPDSYKRAPLIIRLTSSVFTFGLLLAILSIGFWFIT